VIVADLRAVAVLVPVASAGIVHTDPGRRFQPGPQHGAGLIDEGAGVGIEQADDLALGDHDADRPELGHQARHGDLGEQGKVWEMGVVRSGVGG
jgi:hypothetical protein